MRMPSRASLPIARSPPAGAARPGRPARARAGRRAAPRCARRAAARARPSTPTRRAGTARPDSAAARSPGGLARRRSRARPAGPSRAAPRPRDVPERDPPPLAEVEDLVLAALGQPGQQDRLDLVGVWARPRRVRNRGSASCGAPTMSAIVGQVLAGRAPMLDVPVPTGQHAVRIVAGLVPDFPAGHLPAVGQFFVWPATIVAMHSLIATSTCCPWPVSSRDQSAASEAGTRARRPCTWRGSRPC